MRMWFGEEIQLLAKSFTGFPKEQKEKKKEFYAYLSSITILYHLNTYFGTYNTQQILGYEREALSISSSMALP